jgi:hypothetical protein
MGKGVDICSSNYMRPLQIMFLARDVTDTSQSPPIKSVSLYSAFKYPDIEVQLGPVCDLGLVEEISHLSMMRVDVCADWLGLVTAQKIAAQCISHDHISKVLCHRAPRLV